MTGESFLPASLMSGRGKIPVQIVRFMESPRLLHLSIMKTFAATLIVAVALVAGSAAAQTHNGMDKLNDSELDSIAFPLLVREDETSQTFILNISKTDFVAGSELEYVEWLYEDNSLKPVYNIEIVGENDILLNCEEATYIIGNGIAGSRTGTWLRFVPQGDGSYEVSRKCWLSQSWDETGRPPVIPGPPISRGGWGHNEILTEPHKTDVMRILELYNTYVATGKVRGNRF